MRVAVTRIPDVDALEGAVRECSALAGSPNLWQMQPDMMRATLANTSVEACSSHSSATHTGSLEWQAVPDGLLGSYSMQANASSGTPTAACITRDTVSIDEA